MNSFHPDSEGWVPVSAAVPVALKEVVPDLAWGDDIEIVERNLPFHPGSRLLLLRCATWGPEGLSIYALENGPDLIWLNGTSPPLHAYNAKGHLKLTDENVAEYLQFFCFFVRGTDGPFYVIDHLEAPYLPSDLRRHSSDESMADHTKLLHRFFQSIRTFGRAPDGRWRLSATVLYSNAVFIADFMVQPGGMTEMVGDNPILADLPVRIHSPITPDRPSQDPAA